MGYVTQPKFVVMVVKVLWSSSTNSSISPKWSLNYYLTIPFLMYWKYLCLTLDDIIELTFLITNVTLWLKIFYALGIKNYFLNFKYNTITFPRK